MSCLFPTLSFAVPDGTGNEIFQANVGIGTTTPIRGLSVMNGNIGIGTWNPTNALTIGVFSWSGLDIAIGNGQNNRWFGINVDENNNVPVALSAPLGMTFSTSSGGTERLRIDSVGGLGIGTTTPVGGTAIMNGNVGIGTWSPTDMFQVMGALRVGAGDFVADQGRLYTHSSFGTVLTGSTGANYNLLLTRENGAVLIGNESGTNNLRLAPAGGGVGIGTLFASTSGLTVMSGNVGIGTWKPAQALDVVGTVNATAFTGDGSGLTGLGAAGGWTDEGTDVYTTTSTDRVGIGTIEPADKLHVRGGNILITNANPEVRYISGSTNLWGVYASTGGDGSLNFYNYPTTSAPLSLYSTAANFTTNVGIGTTTSVGALTVMRGNVGIGTWSPVYPLQVRGTVRVGGTNGVIIDDAGLYNANNNSTLTLGTTNNVTNDNFTGLSMIRRFNAAVENYDLVVMNAENNGATGSRRILNVQADGASRMVVGYDGNVGVGTTEARGAFVVASGNVGIGTLDPVGGLTVMTGNVGIGTWSPTALLEVAGTVSATAFVGDGSGLTGVGAGFTDGGTNVYNTTTSDLVGIGTTTPDAALEIVESGEAPFMVSLTPAGDGDLFIIDSVGNVGIGTTVTDFAGLAIKAGPVGIGTAKPGNGAFRGLHVVAQGGTSTAIPNAETVSAVFESAGANSVVNSVYMISGRDAQNNLYFGNGGDGLSVAGIEYNIDDENALAFRTSHVANRLVVGSTGGVGLGTTLTTTAGFAVMNGNVGVGTWNPEALLQVGRMDGQAMQINGVTLASTNPSASFGFNLSYQGLNFTNSGGPSTINKFGATPLRVMGGYDAAGNLSLFSTSLPNVTTTDYINFYVGNTLSPIEVMRIQNNSGTANIGIGTTKPNAALAIASTAAEADYDNTGAGDVYIQNDLEVDGSIFLADGTEIDGASDLGGSTGWTDDGDVVRLTTDANRVGIGTTLNAVGTGLAVMNGNVGIGTWNPAGAIEAFYNSANGTAGTESGIRLTLSDTGAVGAGTDTTYGVYSSVSRSGAAGGTFSTYGLYTTVTGTSGGSSTAIGAQFNAAGADNNYGLAAYVTNGVTAGFFQNDYNSTTDVQDVLQLQRRNNGNTAEVGMGGRVHFTLENDNGNARSAAGVEAVWEDPANGSEDGALTLSTGVGGSLSERIRISSTGGVGIGTTTPVGGLTVMNGNVGIGTWKPAYTFETKAGNWHLGNFANMHIDPGSVITTSVGGGAIQFGANPTYLNLSNNVGIGTTLTSGAFSVMTGNVGIGTWSPRAGLEIGNGGTIDNAGSLDSTYIQNDLEVDGSIFLSDGTEINDSTDLGGATGWTDGGTNVFTSATTDNVGIGTTTPSARLLIENADTIDTLRVNDAVADTTPLTINAAGNVGVGTTVPTALFEVTSSAAQTLLKINDTASGTDETAFLIDQNGNVGISTSTTNAKLKIGLQDDTQAAIIVAGGPLSLTAAIQMNLGATSSTATGRGLTVAVDGEGFARGVWYSNGALGIGPGNATRDVFIRRSGANTVMIDSDLAGAAAGLVVTDNIGIGTTLTGTTTGLAVMSGNVGLGTWSAHSALEVNNAAVFSSELNNGNSGAAITINWGAANKQRVTLTDDATFTFTAPLGVANLVLKLVQDGTGSRTVTWPASVNWPGGVAPTLSTAASAIDFVTCYYDESEYYCTSSLNFQ